MILAKELDLCEAGMSKKKGERRGLYTRIMSPERVISVGNRLGEEHEREEKDTNEVDEGPELSDWLEKRVHQR